ncbi:hypothetical protein ACJVDH_00315 [Pedobacter sp. AW1-32]|uniref:hypothetical protein n=1 Tax=Pedobacter sp. AW1-32 TaxID=3383026 RepID=UPI003FEF47E9
MPTYYKITNTRGEVDFVRSENEANAEDEIKKIELTEAEFLDLVAGAKILRETSQKKLN